MTGIEGTKVDIKALRKVYQESAAARRLLDSLATRERNVWVSKVETVAARLAFEGPPVSRGEIVEAMKRLEGIGCGKFYNGRRGHQSRFAWAVGSISVAQAAAGETVKIETPEVPKPGEEETEPEEEGLQTHEFPLRRGLSVKFTLPSNLTATEASRLAKFLELLPQE